MNIFIGNLSRQTEDDNLRQAFESHGQVTTSNIIKDKFSGQSKGFGFVEMPNKSEADSAIASLNGKDLDGSALTVNEARPRSENRDRGNGSRY